MSTDAYPAPCCLECGRKVLVTWAGLCRDCQEDTDGLPQP